MPGNINSQYSLGTNKLLTDGATPIAVVDDIFRGMGINPAMTEEEASDLGKDEKEVYDIIKATGEVTPVAISTNPIGSAYRKAYGCSNNQRPPSEGPSFRQPG